MRDYTQINVDDSSIDVEYLLLTLDDKAAVVVYDSIRVYQVL